MKPDHFAAIGWKRWAALGAIVTVVMMAAIVAKAGEEGGEEKKADAAEDKPWMQTQNRISSLSAKAKQKGDQLRELIEEKKKTTSAERMAELDKQIDVVYKEYKSSSEDLKKQESIFKYRYPERSAKSGERVYHTQDVPSLEKIEEQVGIDGKLQRNMLRMHSQYGTAKKSAKPAATVEATPTPTSTPADNKNIREQDSTILKK